MITRREGRERAKELWGWAFKPSSQWEEGLIWFYSCSTDIMSEVTRHDLIRPVSHYYFFECVSDLTSVAHSVYQRSHSPSLSLRGASF
jgi:hypothetical protein